MARNAGRCISKAGPRAEPRAPATRQPISVELTTRNQGGGRTVAPLTPNAIPTASGPKSKAAGAWTAFRLDQQRGRPD
jgi:hypothetical protein